ncbi:MAG: hypothetical protein QY331_01345 [Melioribacteraceae bacterium]|jgi:hypothetical protein|nr:hypothetical protein [Melioribacteraceae bacterium]RJP59121.1 MAG: hypothetical protein C4543_07100 [Ignavibacteriales bacterium]WKZ69896.1 MAG: hypothetical protein QY331_01345 [Melioribacteraceae bacterium]
MQKDRRKYSYRFEFKNGSEKTFDVCLDNVTLKILRKSKIQPGDWTKMENFQCEHCPLNKSEHKHCPTAIEIEELIKFFSDKSSHEKVKVTVSTPERSYFSETDLQSAVGSLMGVLMSASGCPILSKLRPMLRFHLPFSDLEETEFRVLSMFALAQLLRLKTGKEADWNMKSLVSLYEDIQKINENFVKKLAEVVKKDASLNSVVLLNNLATFVTFNIGSEDFSNLLKLFHAWVDD